MILSEDWSIVLDYAFFFEADWAFLSCPCRVVFRGV